MAKTKIPDWIVVDAVKQCVRCERCGAEEQLKLPAPVSAFLKRNEAFAIEHQRCLPK